MSIIRKKKQDEESTMVANEMLQRKDLSYEAKGVLVELMAMPDGCTITKKGLERSHTGKTKLTRIFKELKDFGYLKIVTKRNAGRFSEKIWEIYGEPNGEKK